MDIQKVRESFERRQARNIPMSYEEFKQRTDEYEEITGRRYGEHSVNEREWIVWLDAWQALQALAVPEGFALLPKIPSEKLIYEELEKIFPCSFCHDGPDSWKRTYIKVIEAAQQDVFQTQEPAND